MKLSLYIFLVIFRVTVLSSKCFEKNTDHMTLSNEAPPGTFSEICSKFFSGQLFHKTALNDCMQGS